jgi:hypothetical protein
MDSHNDQRIAGCSTKTPWESAKGDFSVIDIDDDAAHKVSSLFAFSITSANLSGGRICFKIPRPINPVTTWHTIAIGTEIHQVAIPKNGNTIAAFTQRGFRIYRVPFVLLSAEKSH